MRSIVKGVACLGALCLLAGTAQAADGLLIVQKTTSGETTQTHQIQIESQRMRAESGGANGSKQIVMFDGVKQVMTLMDPAKKTYTELTKEEVERIGGQMSDLMAQMQKQMAALPPEQRAQMEAMMRGRMNAAIPPKRTYRKTGTDTVGKWTCDKYEGYEGEKKVSDICTVDPKVLGFAASDFEVSKQLAAFFKKMIPQAADQMFTIGTTAEQGYAGVPVKSTFTIAGRATTTEIVEVSRQKFPDSLFAVPEGFQKTAFPGAGRARL